MVFIHVMEYYSGLKNKSIYDNMDGFLVYYTSKISQRQKDKYNAIPLIRGIKTSHTHRNTE